MGRIKGKKTITGLFIRHIIWIGIETVLISACLLIVMNILISKKIAYPANSQENYLNNLEKIAFKGENIEGRLKNQYLYALFNEEGTYKKGSIDQDEAEEIYQFFKEHGTYYKERYIKVISSNKGEYYILYDIKMGFYNHFLSRFFPSPDILIIIFFILLFLANLWRIAGKFGKVISGELKRLKGITGSIEKENLEFDIPSSSLKEIDEVFHSVGKLRDNLSKSLHTQWNLESGRRDQIDALGHDLKTPLTIIRGNAELLLECQLNQEESEFVNHIQKNTELMQEYIQKLLEVNRSEEEYKISMEWIDSRSFIQDIEAYSQDLARNKNITLTYKIEEVPDKIFVDSKILKRILLNLMDNAVEYSPENSSILMQIKAEYNSLTFKIEDSGKGFSIDDLKYATKQFYCNDKSRSSRDHLGMGLYFVDIMIKKLGGELRLSNSETLGGARAEILLFDSV
ncbi:sensor histidine kinase [Anaerosacchariphilus polymeriproducens]|uniref:histidine kinase n=1 Tax=Anaerosacchariphilus polymeriproducens TaxID=1812858 RepID=A0A371AXC8_9FIRM|nr:sensor histidine kinase [Anaerosacchariphilus polymeriproducens]